LGGPCKDEPSLILPDRIQAEKSGDWDRAAELEKRFVRASCGNQYRWYGLIRALLKAGRETQAVLVLQEMDARGFDLNPALIGGSNPDVVQLHADAGVQGILSRSEGRAADKDIE